MAKLLYALLFSLQFLIPQKTYAVSPTRHAIALKTRPAVVLAPKTGYPSTPNTYSPNFRFSQFQIDEMLGTYADDNFNLLRKIIWCESQNTNREEIDSNGKMSRSILQFQDSTYATFAPLAGVTSSVMNPINAVITADYMLNRGQAKRWTCFNMHRDWKKLSPSNP